jgi:hypothetical protein
MKTTKNNIIKNINKIIKNYGTFNLGEVEGAEGICINEMGGLVALAEGFDTNVVEANVYEPSSFSSDAIETYNVKYEDLDIEILKEILFVAEMYEADQLKTIKRISN